MKSTLKGIRIGIISILTLIVFMSGCTNNGMSTYSNNGISFNYPSTWKEANPIHQNSVITLADPNSVNLTTPIGVAVLKFPIPSGSDLKSAFNSRYKSMPHFTETDSDITGSITSNREFTEISNQTITINGVTAYEIIYKLNTTSYTNNSANSSSITQIRDVWFENNGNVYEIVMFSSVSDYESQKTYFDTIINTFKVQ